MSPPSPPDSAPTADGPDWVGRILGGRYRVDAVLGSGGMGTAYRAYDQELGRPVVLKAPHARHFSEGEARGRFQDEIRKLIAIEHPHVVRVYGKGEQDGTPYAVFQYLAGGSLGDRMKALGQRLTPDEVVPWLTQVAEALDDLHAHGDVHRDVKPDNILFDRPLRTGAESREKGKTNAYLADFGLAKALGLDPTRIFQSHTGTLIGTQAYMAPEQFDSRARVTGAVDQYALATTVYQALSGQMPFTVSSAEELVFEKALRPPRPLTDVAKHVPADVAGAVMKALSADPNARFPTCGEFAAAVAAGVQAKAPQATVSPPLRTVETPRAPEPLPPLRGPKAASPAVRRAPSRARGAPRGGDVARAVASRSWWRWSAAWVVIVGGLGSAGAFLGWFRGGEVPSRTRESDAPPPTPVSAAGMAAPTRSPVPVSPPTMEADPASAAMGVAPLPQPAMVETPEPSFVSAMKHPSPSPAAPEPPPTAVPEWAKVGPEQIFESRRLKLPVAFQNGLGMRFVLVPSGTFTMGSPEGEKGRNVDETQHRVNLTQAYYVSIHETTNGQYRRYKKDHDSGKWEQSGREESLNGDTQPVVNVSHTEAVEFATWLSGQEGGRTYRLPTESEWEYACRAGTTTRFSFGDRDEDLPRFGNFSDKNDPSGSIRMDLDDGASVTAPVGRYTPNGWGLYDMHGNVWEWCADWKEDYPTGTVTDPAGPSAGTVRVVRGGSWGLDPVSARAAVRSALSPDGRVDFRGFRLVLPSRAAQ